MKESGGHGTWTKRRAEWYSAGLRTSDYAEKVVAVIAPIVSGCSSLLDVGAGTGALCIPLARMFTSVTALDSSTAMLDELRKTARSAGVGNIRTEVASWEDVDDRTGEFDVVLCANVPGVVDSPAESILRLAQHANRFVFLVLGTPRNANKFFLRDLWPLMYGEDLPKKPDYFTVYEVLYRLGIFANISVVDYDFDQPFSSLDEAVLFWKDHLRVQGTEHDALLRDFLSAQLERSEDTLWARVPKQSAVMWWETNHT
jgi:SAM-dependent methyltransferase